MIRVYIDNCYGKIVGLLPAEVILDIDKKLSFEVPGAYYSEKFRTRVWDGKTHLYRKTSQTFPTGLFPYIREILVNNNISYQVVDNRQSPILGVPKNLQNITLRDYQQQVINTSIQKTRGVIKVATGGGKSAIIAGIIGRLNIPSIIYIHKRDIFYQLHANLEKWLGEEIGLIGAGHREIKKFNIAMMQTVAHALGIIDKKKKDIYEDEDDTSLDKQQIEELVTTAPCMIVDECHHCSVGIYKKIHQMSKGAYYRYGFSASPWREDNADLLIHAFSTETICDIPASQLIEQGYLSKPTIYFLQLKYPTDSYRFMPYADLYKTMVVNNKERHMVIAKLALSAMAFKKSVLIAVTQIDHGQQLEAILHTYCRPEEKEKIKFVMGSSDDETRKKALEGLNNGVYNIIIATSVFGEGVDIPELDVLISAKSQESSVDAFQLLGRAIRKTETKSQAVIIDIWDDIKYLRKHALNRERIYQTERQYEIKKVKKIEEIDFGS